MDKLNGRRTDSHGMTMIELLVVIAILAILSVIGYSIVSLLSPSSTASGSMILKEAVRQFTIQSLTNEGAELNWNGQNLVISALGSNPVTKHYLLPVHAQITLDGQPFQCLVLNPRGFPDNAAMQNCKNVADPAIPLEWSIKYGHSQVTFQ